MRKRTNFSYGGRRTKKKRKRSPKKSFHAMKQEPKHTAVEIPIPEVKLPVKRRGDFPNRFIPIRPSFRDRLDVLMGRKK